MKIRIGCIFLTVVLILGLVGCGSVGDKQMSNESVSEEQKVIVPTGIMVPVAEHEEVIFPINDFNISYVFLGDTFVYMEREWDREAGMNICTLSRVAADGMSEPEQFYQNTTEQPSIWCFTMDDHENIYTLDWLPVSSNRQWFLHKSDKNMQELASVILDESVFPAGRLNSVDDIVVDSYGNVALLDYQNSWIYFFDKDLNFTGKDDVSLIFIEGRFVNAGEQGAFLWDSDIMTQNITLQKLNFE